MSNVCVYTVLWDEEARIPENFHENSRALFCNSIRFTKLEISCSSSANQWAFRTPATSQIPILSLACYSKLLTIYMFILPLLLI